jgi:hypothetical protein
MYVVQGPTSEPIKQCRRLTAYIRDDLPSRKDVTPSLDHLRKLVCVLHIPRAYLPQDITHPAPPCTMHPMTVPTETTDIINADRTYCPFSKT